MAKDIVSVLDTQIQDYRMKISKLENLRSQLVDVMGGVAGKRRGPKPGSRRKKTTGKVGRPAKVGRPPMKRGPGRPPKSL